MTDERKDEAPAASAEEWPKRAGPTIDLDASEVSGDTRKGGNAASGVLNQARERLSAGRDRAWLGLIAGLSGAIAAVLVFAAFWSGGMIGQQPTASVSPVQFDNVAANVGDLTARLARVEASAGKATAPANDPALAGRIDGLEKSIAAVREEATALRANLRTMITQLNDLKAAPRDGAAPAVDLAPLDERLTRLEQAIKSLAAEQAKPAPASVDDINVRRLVVANTLEAAVRRGDAYATALAAAKQVAANPTALSPLDPFAAKGIPSEASYLRDIVPVLQRIADAGASKPASSATTSSSESGVLDRLQSGLARFVRVERDTGPPAKDVPLTQAAVRRDDLTVARQDIAKLPQASDPQIQAWIKAVDAREAALVAAQKFSAEALAAVGKSGQ
jgi:hypothetical protein